LHVCWGLGFCRYRKYQPTLEVSTNCQKSHHRLKCGRSAYAALCVNQTRLIFVVGRRNSLVCASWVPLPANMFDSLSSATTSAVGFVSMTCSSLLRVRTRLPIPIVLHRPFGSSRKSRCRSRRQRL
jgi:hypothetical protein